MGGTNNPRFPLRYLFEHEVFPATESLSLNRESMVDTSRYLGVIIMDHTGRRNIRYLTRFVKHTEKRGGEYGNRNYLAVFPAMSKHHRIFLMRSSVRKDIKEIWDQYPSPAITRGHILAYQLMQK